MGLVSPAELLNKNLEVLCTNQAEGMRSGSGWAARR